MTIHTKNEYFRKVTNVNNPLMENENKQLERAQELIENELVSGDALISNNDPSFFNANSIYPNPMSLRILSEVARLERDSKDESADLKAISGDISILIHDTSKKIARTLKSDKNDDKFFTMLEKLATKVDVEYDLIEKIYSKESTGATLKPSQIKKSNYRK